MKLRLAKGVRLCDPLTGTYYKYGGRYVGYVRRAPNGFIVEMKDLYYFVTYEQCGMLTPAQPQQLRLAF